MKTKGRTLYSIIDKSGRLDETQLEQDLNSVKEWYQDHGYIDVEIKEVRRDRSNGKMTLVVVVVEGPQYRVGKLRVTGAKVASEQKIRTLMKMKEGKKIAMMKMKLPPLASWPRRKIKIKYKSGGKHWVMDSGFSQHMIDNSHIFTTLE